MIREGIGAPCVDANLSDAAVASIARAARPAGDSGTAVLDWCPRVSQVSTDFHGPARYLGHLDCKDTCFRLTA